MNFEITFSGGSRDGRRMQLELSPNQLEIILPMYGEGYQKEIETSPSGNVRQEVYRRATGNDSRFEFVKAIMQ